MPGAYLLAANHISHFDPPLITAVTRRKIDWMATAEFFAHPVARFYFWAVDTFRTDRFNVDRAGVRTALDRLKRGRVVGIFPERGIRAGERSILGGAPLDSGIGTLADLAGVPILPCVIVGTDRLYNKKFRLPGRHRRFWVGYGAPITVPSGVERKAARLSAERELCEAMRALLAEMTEKFSLSPDDIPKSPQERMAEA
jgi:1-acyl-sn-glycerol-3-phosphate acyltransferase